MYMRNGEKGLNRRITALFAVSLLRLECGRLLALAGAGGG